ncbi:MAG: BTAD domain-containing putative transcriptional regulator [Acidimicrobiia bacterium]
MEFSVLGALQMERRGQPCVLTRPKSRALLGLLLARANESVSADQLIDELWLGRPPTSAEIAFRVHVTHLRRALDPVQDADASPVEYAAGSYRISVTGKQLDALQFETALNGGRAAAEAGAPRESLAALEDALACWRGPAYADLRDFEPMRAEGVRLDSLRQSAIEVIADAHLALGAADAACEILAPAAAEDPLREGLTERLMLALYRTGRQGEALRAYSRLREALETELGVPPGPSVRALEESIILQDPDLEAPPATGPRTSISVTEPLQFVGRRAETDELERVWQAATAGVPQLVLIAGPAGIGKTALAEHAAQSIAESGANVFVGRCEPDPASDYEPFPQLVRSLLELTPANHELGPFASELARLVPDLAGQLAEPQELGDAAAGRHRLFVAVTALFGGLAPGPALIILDDLHWAGRDALALLSHLMRDLRGRFMVIGTYRDDEAEPGTPLGDALEHGRLARPDVALALHGLDAPELRAMVQAAAPRNVSLRLLGSIATLQELTAGNPFFVREVVRELMDAPSDIELSDLAPGGVSALVERRLIRLSPGTRDLLSVAAILGREFSLQQLTLTARVSEDAALAAIEEARRARFVSEADEIDHFTFGHPLIRNVLYTSMTASRRTRLHLRAGEALADDAETRGPGNYAEPARHLLMALPLGSPARAADLARLAGDDATARFAYTDAAAWYRSALRLAADADWPAREEAATLLALGEALELSGQREHARAAFVQAAARAKVAGDMDLFADIAITATPRYITIDEFHPTHLAMVDEALDGVVTDARRRAWLLCCAGAARYYDDTDDGPLARRAMSLARDSDDPEVQAAGLITYHRWLSHDAAMADERLELSRSLRELCEREQLHHLTGRACRALLVDLLGLGQLDDFDVELQRFSDVANAHAIPGDLYWVCALRATRAMLRSPGGETEELVRAAHVLGRRLEQGDAEGTFILQMFALRYQQGRSREITAPLETPAPEHPRMLAGLAILAAALVAGERLDAARAILDQVVFDGELQLPHDNLWLAATALFGGVAAATGTPEQRALFARTLAPFADHWCVFGAGGAVFGTTHHWLGQLALAEHDVKQATGHFARAVELAEAGHADYWAAAARDWLASAQSDPS